MKYEFKTKPFDHQKDVLQESWAESHYALFMEMGTGKSKVVVDNMAVLNQTGQINAALIIAPKGVFDNWVMQEIPTHMPDKVSVQLLRWQPNLTKTFEEKLTTLVLEPFNGLKILVMNVEGLSTAKALKAATLFLTKNPNNMVVVDESTTIKNRKAKRTANIIGLRNHSKYRRILTGSPITKSPMDLYAQCEFLKPGLLGFKSYYAFRARYCAMRPLSNEGNRQIDALMKNTQVGQQLSAMQNQMTSPNAASSLGGVNVTQPTAPAGTSTIRQQAAANPGVAQALGIRGPTAGLLGTGNP